MAIAIAKIATDEDIKKITEKNQIVHIIKSEDYLYKGEPLNIGIPFSLENIKEGHFFEIDDKPIIELDRIRRCFNMYIRGIDPRCEYYSENDELKEKLASLSDNFKGTLHNRLVNNLYITSIKYCRFWSKFLDNLTMLLMVNDSMYSVPEVMLHMCHIYDKYAYHLIDIHLDDA